MTNGYTKSSGESRPIQYIRRETIDPFQRGEAFIFHFAVAHAQARVERIETLHGEFRSVGVLWVRDLGDPSELPQDRVVERGVICVPLFGKQRQAPIPELCGDYLGTFIGDRVRWFVFSPRDNGEQKSAPGTHSGKAGTPSSRGSQSTGQALGGRPARPQGNQQPAEGKKSP